MIHRPFDASGIYRGILLGSAVFLLSLSPTSLALEPIEEGCDITGGSTGAAIQACTNGIKKRITFNVTAHCSNPCNGSTWQANSIGSAVATGTCGCGAIWLNKDKTETIPPWSERYYSEAHSRVWSASQNRCINMELAIAEATCSCVGCGNPSPIVISLSDEVYELTDAANGVLFDLDGDGKAEQTAWTARGAEDGFLVLDRNLNGVIDDFMEVFGDHTPQLPSKEPNGWLALAVWDDAFNGGNEDGVIDTADFIFAALQIWVDRNHNGFSEAQELSTLEEVGLEYLDLNYGSEVRIDGFNNVFKFPSEVGRTNGEITMAWDIFFARAIKLP